MAFRAAGSQNDPKRMKTERDAFITDLSHPQELILPPESDILIVASRRKQLVIRMDGKAPQLSSMSKNNLKGLKLVLEK